MDTIKHVEILQEDNADHIKREKLGESLRGQLGEVIGLDLQGNLLANPNSVLPKGTLIHNTRFDLETLAQIVDKGLLPHEDTGNKNPATGAAVAGAVYAFELPEPMTLEEYGQFCAQNPGRVDSNSRLKSSVGQESSIYPGTAKETSRQGNAYMVALIMDQNLVSAPRADDYDGMQGRSVAFLGAVPAAAIAGIVVGEGVAADAEATRSIAELLPGRSVFGSSGELLTI